MADNKEAEKPIELETDEGEMSEAEIDQNLVDTFPASDPPSWTLGIDHGQDQNSQTSPGDVPEDTEG